MSAVLDEQTTTVVLEALDFEVPCTQGEHAAEVLVRCRGCAEGSLLCRNHLEKVRAHVEAFVETAPGLVVLFCNCGRQASTFDALVEVVPL